MSQHISGILLGKDYSRNLNELKRDLYLEVTPLGESNFQTACNDLIDQDSAYILCTPQATLFFLHPDRCQEAVLVKQVNSLSFVIDETDMTTEFYYAQRGYFMRSVIEQEGDVVEHEGDELDIETQYAEMQDVVWDLVEEILGKNFWDLGPQKRVIKCSVTFLPKPIAIPKHPEPVIDTQQEQESEENRAWWQFWKKK